MSRSGPVPSAARLTSKGAQTRHRVSSSQSHHYFAAKGELVRAVIEYQEETIVGGQEPMLTRLDSLAGIRARRDFLAAHQRQLQCRGGAVTSRLRRRP